jgi:hypothetical protein
MKNKKTTSNCFSQFLSLDRKNTRDNQNDSLLKIKLLISMKQIQNENVWQWKILFLTLLCFLWYFMRFRVFLIAIFDFTPCLWLFSTHLFCVNRELSIVCCFISWKFNSATNLFFFLSFAVSQLSKKSLARGVCFEAE